MKPYTLVFSLLLFANIGLSQGFNVTTSIVSPSYCRTSSSQNGGGTLSAIVSGGSGNHYINWINSAGIVFSNSTIVAGLNPGMYTVEVIDTVTPANFTENIFLDSVNPIADFALNSNDLIDLGNDEYLGHVSVDVEFENTSQNFVLVNLASSDTVFQWNIDTTNTGWFFKYDVGSVTNTYSPGEYVIGLIAKNHNDCRDTAYARMTVEETVDLKSNLKEDISVTSIYDQRMIYVASKFSDADLHLSIFNINGQLVQSTLLNESKSAIYFNHPRGIYLYQVSNDSGVLISDKFQF
ncbi:MAG: T9SS type A sorting domain-containing protein [Crocinitomicaceae bacterium]